MAKAVPVNSTPVEAPKAPDVAPQDQANPVPAKPAEPLTTEMFDGTVRTDY